jgi:hypothetical protein
MQTITTEVRRPLSAAMKEAAALVYRRLALL